jgi:hypothetical protein
MEKFKRDNSAYMVTNWQAPGKPEDYRTITYSGSDIPEFQ